MTLKSVALLAAVSCGVLFTVRSVHAFDLTGHWEGKWNCKGFDGAKFTDRERNSSMNVTQVGNTLRVDLDGGFLCNGAAIPDEQ
jgi:hypothetical protein